MALEVKVAERDLVNLRAALVRVPRQAAAEIKREMSGRTGIGPEYKTAIAKTFRGNFPQRTLRGEKWLYSRRASKQEQAQIRHYVAGSNLDTLETGIFATDPAELQQFGGTVGSRTSPYLAIPIGGAGGATFGSRGNVRQVLFSDTGKRARVQPRDIQGDVFVIRTPGNRLFLVRRNDDGELEFLFKLVRTTRHAGGRLDFFGAVARQESRTTQRFDRALGRALKTFEARP